MYKIEFPEAVLAGAKAKPFEPVCISKTFKTYATLHGPIMAQRDGKWISLKSNNRSMDGLVQSWVRTKSKGLEDYTKAMDLKANTSNNTVFADSRGNIAYWHGNFLPIRDPKLDWSKVMDGTTSATQWKGLHEVSESVHVYNPSNGWLQNCNSTLVLIVLKKPITHFIWLQMVRVLGE